jgi:hypothetical protein
VWWWCVVWPSLVVFLMTLLRDELHMKREELRLPFVVVLGNEGIFQVPPPLVNSPPIIDVPMPPLMKIEEKEKEEEEGLRMLGAFCVFKLYT